MPTGFGWLRAFMTHLTRPEVLVILVVLVVLPDVRHVGGDAVRDRVRPADPPKLGRDLGVVQVGMVTAVAADDLECVGVAAFRLAPDEADRLAAEDDRPAEPELITGHHVLIAIA
jgi:hypothetical protein